MGFTIAEPVQVPNLAEFSLPNLYFTVSGSFSILKDINGYYTVQYVFKIKPNQESQSCLFQERRTLYCDTPYPKGDIIQQIYDVEQARYDGLTITKI